MPLRQVLGEPRATSSLTVPPAEMCWLHVGGRVFFWSGHGGMVAARPPVGREASGFHYYLKISMAVPLTDNRESGLAVSPSLSAHLLQVMKR